MAYETKSELRTRLSRQENSAKYYQELFEERVRQVDELKAALSKEITRADRAERNLDVVTDGLDRNGVRLREQHERAERAEEVVEYFLNRLKLMGQYRELGSEEVGEFGGVMAAHEEIDFKAVHADIALDKSKKSVTEARNRLGLSGN